VGSSPMDGSTAGDLRDFVNNRSRVRISWVALVNMTRSNFVS